MLLSGEEEEGRREEGEEEEEEDEEEESVNPTYSVLRTVFLDVMPCNLVEIYRRFKGAAGAYSEKSVKYVPQYTASHPRRQSLFTATPSEPRTATACH